MIDKNNIPVGYKDSRIGIIPQEWEVMALGKLVSITSGNSPSLYNLHSVGKYPYIKVEDMNNCEKYQMLSRDYTDDERNLVPKGSIIFPKRGAAIINNKVRIAVCDLCMDSNMMAIVPNKSVNGEFLYFKIIHEQLFKIADTSTIPQINNKHIIPYILCLPPLAEQKKIAEVLSAWDDAIEKQSKLIEKLELRKRGLMQRLLTGKTRLPGFTEPWKKIELGEVGAFLSTNTLSRDKLNSNEGTIKNIHYGDILIKYAEIVNVSNVEIPFINKGVVVSSEYIENGDIVFADTAEDYTVGKAIEIINVNGNKIVAGLHTMLFRPRKNIFVECYLGYYINSEYYQSQLLPLTQGIKVCSITKKGISQTKVLIPEKSEQKAIAAVLTSADKEIEIQRKKLEALRQQKQGLMQQLLTGKTRVKV